MCLLVPSGLVIGQHRRIEHMHGQRVEIDLSFYDVVNMRQIQQGRTFPCMT